MRRANDYDPAGMLIFCAEQGEYATAVRLIVLSRWGSDVAAPLIPLLKSAT
jgi:hypothetical protein